MPLPKTLPTVVIVGRPNVGKSTLFNRITGKRRSIVGGSFEVQATGGDSETPTMTPDDWKRVKALLADAAYPSRRRGYTDALALILDRAAADSATTQAAAAHLDSLAE